MDKDEYDDGRGAALPEFYDNKKLRGIRAGEITLWTSGIGSGYSEVAQRRSDMDHGKFLESTNTIKPIRAETARDREVTHGT